MLKKLGAKQILGDVKAVVAALCHEDKATADVYSIYGSTNGIKTGTTQYGEFTAFQGQFEAINYYSGEKFAAIQCFIPEPLQTLIKAAMQEHDKVEFAFTVSVKRRDDLKEGYEYLVTPHKEAQEADPLEKLRTLIPSPKPHALEAPKEHKAAKAK
jgi:hypothetical protein